MALPLDQDLLSSIVLKNIYGIIFIVSPTGLILYCSESIYSLLGYHTSDFLGNGLQNFMDINDINYFNHKLSCLENIINLQFSIKHRNFDSYITFNSIGQLKLINNYYSYILISYPSSQDVNEQLKIENEYLKNKYNELLMQYNNDINPCSFISSPTNTSFSSSIPDQPHFVDSNNKENLKRKKKSKLFHDYMCNDCGTTSSPEWRKGPCGPKTLCNACGLRWAKKNKKIELNCK